MIAVAKKSEDPETATWHAGFLRLMPLIESWARVAFRDMREEAREDAVAEVAANAMCAYRRLHERGELQRAFASVLAKYAVSQFWEGRRVGTPQSSRDVYSSRSRMTAGYTLLSLGTPGEQVGGWKEYLIDNRQTSVPDQVCFRIDFPQWLDSQSPRNKRIAECLSIGDTTGEVADKFNISPARVSQLRRELAESWHTFIEPVLDKPEDNCIGM